MGKVSDEVVEKLKTHNVCTVRFFENLFIYEIMWRYTVGKDTIMDNNII